MELHTRLWAVCEPDLDLDRSMALIAFEQNLLRRGPEGRISVRFYMLRIIREYAIERLEERSELENLQHRHAMYLLGLTEQANREFHGADQQVWSEIVAAEHNNIRVVLEWCFSHPPHHEVGLRLVVLLTDFWIGRGHLWEGREWVVSGLANLREQAGTKWHARIVYLGGRLAYRQNDLQEARRLFGVPGFEPIPGEPAGDRKCIDGLGNVETDGRKLRNCNDKFQAGLEISLREGKVWEQARTYVSLGWGTLRQGDYAQASAYLEKALDLYREGGDKYGAAFTLAGLGEIATRLGYLPRASAILEESLKLRREMGDKWGIGVSSGTLGWIAIQEGDYSRARQVLGESLSVRNEIGDKGGMAWCLEKLAEVAKLEGVAERAVTLYGAASALRRSTGSVIDPVDQPEYERRLAELRGEVGKPYFEAAWKTGEGFNQQERMTYSLQDFPPPASS
jgi:tetratricopeptide (TPR) repeat protein